MQLAVNPDAANSAATRKDGVIVNAESQRSMLLPEIVAQDQLVAENSRRRPANRAPERVDDRGSERRCGICAE